MQREEFAVDLRESVLAAREVEEQEDFAENAFVRKFMSYLADAGEVDDAEVAFYKAHGVKLNAYVIDIEAESLDLVVAIYSGQVPPPTISKTQIEQAFRQLLGFLQKAQAGVHQRLEESGPAFEASRAVHQAVGPNAAVSRVRLFLVTDGVVKTRQPDEVLDGIKAREEGLEGLQVSHHIWDLERLFRWYSSGAIREEIEIDVVAMLGEPLACLAMPATSGSDYQSFLAYIPAPLLADIYGRFGSRLLERNVRSFLQVRGAINKGIRKTLLETPARFLAYNNGLAATASNVTLVRTAGGAQGIERLKNFQIVNGGQTTASIFHCARKDGADLTQAIVQLKLTVIEDAARVDEIVPLISQFANSQNKVSLADFSANDPFHRKLEELSRTLWAPAKSGAQRQTRWFYERARGQYADERARSGTKAKVREFELMNPRNQMFTKTDFAKFENTWMQRPHLVSRGAQKNFAALTIEQARAGSRTPDDQYFQWLVAKALLFRRSEQLIQAEGYGGYRANIVTYTLALIAHATAQRLALDDIWQHQEVGDALEKVIVAVSRVVQPVIANPPDGRNVTEWCKSEACWEAVRQLEVTIPRSLKLIPLLGATGGARQDAPPPDQAEEALIESAATVPAATWFALSNWAKATSNLAPWQRMLAYGLGKLASQERRPSVKQARQGLLALKAGTDLGFVAPSGGD